MCHSLLLSALTSLWLAAPLCQEDATPKKNEGQPPSQEQNDKKDTADKTKKGKELPKPKRKVGRPGDLTSEEEDQLDRILDAFIAHDIGLRPDPRTVTALRNMGPEAIPALIRALNKSAMMSDSCPVSMFHRKLVSLLQTVDDEEVVRLARMQIGSGVRRSPYQGLLTHLRVVASERQAYLARTRQQTETRQKGSTGKSDSRFSKEKE